MPDIMKKSNPKPIDGKAVPAMSKREAVKQHLEEMAKAAAQEHIVAEGETLSHIALKYYGKATRPYYELIYKHNLDVIGENINIIVPGQKLLIPELPESMK